MLLEWLLMMIFFAYACISFTKKTKIKKPFTVSYFVTERVPKQTMYDILRRFEKGKNMLSEKNPKFCLQRKYMKGLQCLITVIQCRTERR